MDRTLSDGYSLGNRDRLLNLSARLHTLEDLKPPATGKKDKNLSIFPWWLVDLTTEEEDRETLNHKMKVKENKMTFSDLEPGETFCWATEPEKVCRKAMLISPPKARQIWYHLDCPGLVYAPDASGLEYEVTPRDTKKGRKHGTKESK